MNPQENHDINILIVDDNPDILYTLELSLEQDGLNIFTTSHPRQVEQMCINQDISIVLLDVQMPEMNGLEVLEILKNNSATAHVPVILMTGHSTNSEEVVIGLRKGAVDFLLKPLDLYITQAKINSLITLVNHEKEIRRKNLELENFQQELFLAIDQAKKSKAVKENFLANMSHEIRTPLTAINGLTNLLKKTKVDEEQLHLINLLEHSTKSLLGLVNDILDSEKIDAGKISITNSDTNIVTLIRNICDLSTPLAHEKGLQLKCHIDENVPSTISADSLRINQILMNLISNAIKFTESGHIELKVLTTELNNDKVQLQFSVSDTGIGIPQSSINKIFKRFEQADDKTWQKFGGTGLGLSIVKRLIELKGGTLTVESTVGKGTTFVFTNWYDIAVEKAADENLSKGLQAFAQSDNIKILLAEDNPVNQLITTKILKEWNINVDIAVNGADAFEKLKRNDYNLILMDTHMPVMNGYDATRKIRSEMDEAKKNIPIISFSASVMESEKATARAAGIDDFISKPFEPDNLYHKIFGFINNGWNRMNRAS